MWFLDSPIFTRWLETEKQTLFCPGIPGAGKTIMAASVIAKLQHELSHGDGGLAYIYCTYNERHTARDLIASILKQLSSQLPAIPQKVNELYTAHRVHRSSLQMNDLRSALMSVLSCFPKVFIVIDAIDECQDDKNRAELLEDVKELKPHASILVTSRHSGAIEDAFERDVWLEIEASATDIKTYVGSQIHKRDFVLSNELADDSNLRSRIINAIVSKSRGM
jgi:Cdc6-like AAA superfamily ATPase